MTYSDFTILLARQRSGTNAIRRVLESNADVFCFPEVFSVIDKDSEDDLTRAVNFYNFAERYARGHVARVLPGAHEELFRDYLEYLRCFSSRRALVIDVKYNSAHLLVAPWSDNFTSPLLFQLIQELELNVLNVKRKNYLRYVLSNEKAKATGQWHTWTPMRDRYIDEPIELDVGSVVEQLKSCMEEDFAVDRRFANYPHFIAWEYTDVFQISTGGVCSGFAAAAADLLGVTNRFDRVPEYTKQAQLPLEKSILNYQEVASALRGTRFEQCLDDEPLSTTKRRRRSQRVPA
jgi:hypothetical protein